MNQRYPQSRHTPHGGSEKTDTEKGTRARKRKRAQGGLGQWHSMPPCGRCARVEVEGGRQWGGGGWPAERKGVCVGAGVGREGGARGARLWRAGRSAAGGGDAAASDLQGGGARQGSAAGKAAGLHLGQGGQGRLVEVGAHRSTACDEKSWQLMPTREVASAPEAPEGAAAGASLHRQGPPARACTGRSAGSAQARPGCTRAAAGVGRRVRGARAYRGARGGI